MTTMMQDGIRTFEITIPGKEPFTMDCTPAEAWARVEQDMKSAPEGVPVVREIKPTVVPGSAPVPKTHDDAVRGGVSASGAERSTVDLLAAQAAGFAPKRPYFDRGTPVIDLGVQNARASHRSWEAQPRIGNAIDTFVGHIKAENRRDALVPIGSLAMRESGVLTGDKGDWHVEPEALSQLATRLGVPAPGFLVAVWPELRARAWNQLLATAIGHERSTCPADHDVRKRLDGDQIVRARLRNGDGPTSMWAALSDSYAVFDVDSIALALKDGLRAYPDARCEIEYDGRSAKLDVLFHSNVKPEAYVAGEFFKAGLRVRTSDSGGGSVNVSLLLWQNLCLNLICLDVGTYNLAKLRHIGNAEVLADRFSRAVKQGEDRLGHFLKAWGFATNEALVSGSAGSYRPTEALRVLDAMDSTDTFTETELLTGVFKGLAQQESVSILRDDLPGLLAAHAVDESSARQLVPVTRASVINAITRYAHTDVGRHNPLRQMDLEREAGSLIVNSRGGNPLPLPFLPPTRS